MARETPARALRAGALARSAGVSTDTLRVYERKGLLPKARRSPNGYREYAPEAAARVRLVRQALAIGFTLDELARVFKVRDQGGAPCGEVRALGAAKLALLDARLDELARARDRLRGVLARWDAILAVTPRGARAALLDALEGLVEAGAPSPFVPPALRRRR
ncbi:MAG TPA: MerR family transcriptional regulator [Vicinamibacteria bacterium]|nr:MerR family transcriptional regulator [Vicinamibacteria bacterium]